MIGSHLDTVPNSGAFDGILGVMMGLALVESLEGEKLPFAIELDRILRGRGCALQPSLHRQPGAGWPPGCWSCWPPRMATEFPWHTR